MDVLNKDIEHINDQLMEMQLNMFHNMKERVRKYAILEELLRDKEKQLEYLVSELYVGGC